MRTGKWEYQIVWQLSGQMMHVRQQIRDVIVGRLQTLEGLTVYESRVYPSAKLPSVAVFSRHEEVQSTTVDPGSMLWQVRITTIEVEIAVRSEADESIEDALDEWALKVEKVLAFDDFRFEYGEEGELQGADFDLRIDKTPIGIVRLSYAVQYRVLGNAPDQAIL